MPKEIVQFANSDLPHPTSLELHWSRPEGGGNLQLHFRRHNFDAGHHGECTEACSSEIDQFSDQLSRDDCNRLIRALRRARDAVYGADA